MITLEGRRIEVVRWDEYQPCRAEIVECSCPDDCERDHSNE